MDDETQMDGEKKSDATRVSISIPKWMLDEIDDVVENGTIDNRSELFKESVALYLSLIEYAAEDLQEEL